MRRSALDVLKQTAAELGLPIPAEGVSSQETTSIQLMALLNGVGYELTHAFEWSFLYNTNTITTVAGQSAYTLPLDFERIINQTIWSKANIGPVHGPMSPQKWQASVEGIIGPTIEPGFRIKDFNIHFYPAPTATGEEISFEYASNGWVQSFLDPNRFTNYISNDNDVPLFDFWLLVRFLKVKMWQAKGLNTNAYETDFIRLFNALISTDKGAPRLSLTPGRTNRLISNRNAPDTGFGQ